MPDIIEKEGCRFELLYGNYGSATLCEIFDKDIYGFDTVPLNGIVVDIGANLGAFTIACAVKKACTVYSYEPAISNFRTLNINVGLNKVQSRVHIFNQAIADRKEKRKFYYRQTHPAGSTLFQSGFVVDNSVECYDVDCITIEDVFIDNNLYFVDFLKVDAECAEQFIFTKELSSVLKKVKYIAMEWHLKNGFGLSDFLRTLGFATAISDDRFVGGILKARNLNFNV